MAFLRVRSLQSKILFLFLVLLLIVQLISFFFTYRANLKLESTQLNNRIENATDVFKTQFESRRYYLSAFAETAAKDYGLKSVLAEDNKSFLVALNNHRKRIDSDLAMAIDENGKVFAQLMTYQSNNGQRKVRIGADQGKSFNQSTMLIDDNSTQLVMSNNHLYQLSFAPLKSGARVIGWVGFGYLIDASLATELSQLTNVNIGFVTYDGAHYSVIASSDEQNYPVEGPIYQGIITNTEQQYIYNRIDLGSVENQSISAVLFESRADLLKNIDIQWPRLALLVVITVVLSIFGAVGIAKSISHPITQLISQVKSITQGNYSGHVAASGSQELQQLSDEFNHMTTAILSREEQISFQAFHDPLTHLPNRNALIKSVEQSLHTQRPFLIVQLCFLRAEDIIDTLGYQARDAVVQDVATQLQQAQLGCDCFHLGAENFVLTTQQQDVTSFIVSIQNTLSAHCEYENISLHMQFVFGAVLSNQHAGSQAAELLQKTNVAIQRAKNDKKLFQIYDPIFDQNAVERLFLTNSLKHAIEHNELVLHFQPKLCLKTMHVSHVEALVRWQHPDKGLIPPDAFISIAEKTGQMDALTRWVTQAAIEQYNVWLKQGIVINIAINISAENLLDKAYSDFLITLKDHHQLSEHAITLEVTEDAVVADPTKATEILHYLRDNGFKLSIDDYGTGYSSLAQLKQLPVQELKIDRSFVQHLAHDESDKIIVKSTIELAHNMGLSVVAEGIEDENTLLWLQSYGCELAQGYFISKPLPADAFTHWINTTHYQIKEQQDA